MGGRWTGTVTDDTVNTVWAYGKPLRPGGFGLYAPDGTSGRIVLSDAFMDNEGVNTIALWFYTPGAASNHRRIFNRGSLVNGGVAGNRSYFYLENDGANTIFRGSKLGVSTFSFRGMAQSGNYTLSAWNHLVVVVDSGASAGSRILFYTNGKIASMGTETWNGNFASDDGVETCLSGNTNGTNRSWNGYLDDYRFYNRAMSASEVSALYQASISGYANELNWSNSFSLKGASASAQAAKAGMNYKRRR